MFENIKKQSILYIIDDNVSVCKSLEWMFDSIGFQTKTFNSAKHFLVEFNPNQIGCALVDVRMPGMSGLELQEEIHKRNILLPIIFMTGHADSELATQCKELGAFDFLEKPIDSKKLFISIENAINYHCGLINALDPAD